MASIAPIPQRTRNADRVTFTTGSIWEPPTSTKSKANNPLRDDNNRLVAYLARMKILTMKAIKANVRYTAYSSDFGEAFRPTIPSWAVKASYGIVGLYIVGDIGIESYHVKEKGGSNYEIGRKAGHATMFQGFASLAIPTIVIHSAVKYSRMGFVKYLPSQLKWGPSIFGLCLIPLLPLCDEPVEAVVDGFFDKFVPVESPWGDGSTKNKIE